MCVLSRHLSVVFRMSASTSISIGSLKQRKSPATTACSPSSPPKASAKSPQQQTTPRQQNKRTVVPSSSSSLVERLVVEPLRSHAFLVLLAVRCCAAVYNQIWDCDETYNYWEPLHFLLYGNGFQTWEYSPVYSLRSYLYLGVHAAPLVPLVHLAISKIYVFFALRFVLALVSSACEAYMFAALRRIEQTARLPHVATFYLLLTLSNVGMFLSATALLPSTSCQYLATLAFAALIDGRSRVCIAAVGASVLLVWPFAAILGVPCLVHMLLQHPRGYFLKHHNYNKTHSFIQIDP